MKNADAIVDLPADVQQYDETGYVLAFWEEAATRRSSLRAP